MPRNETILSLLLASPSDLTPEREAVTSAVGEVNKSLRVGLRFDVQRWEHDVYPRIGTDAQDVVNQQIAADPDVLLLVMWTRIGAATPRASSGTVEEYELALARWLKDPSSVSILVYFKDGPISPHSINPDQLAAVQKFRQRVAADGVFYKTFAEPQELEGLVRLNLINLAYERGAPRTSMSPNPSKVLSTSAHEENVLNVVPSEDEPGFFDLVEAATDHLGTLLQVSNRLTAAQATLTDAITERTSQIDAQRAAGGHVDVRAMKRISNLTAEDMQRYVVSVRIEIPLFSRHFDLALRAVSGFISIYAAEQIGDGDSTRLESLAQFAALPRSLADSLRGSRPKLVLFAETVERTPRATSTLNRARRETVGVVHDLLVEWDRAIRMSDEVTDSINQLAKSK